MQANTAAADPLVLQRAVQAAETMYPDDEVKVRRGRVIVVNGDLIRLVKYADLDRAYRAGKPSDTA